MTNNKIRFYMDLAEHVARQATCPRASVGAVIVRDDRVLSMGYNGSPRKIPHCRDAGCWIQERDGTKSCVRAVHAEANAVANAAYMGMATRGGVVFATHYPCVQCLKLIINAGIEEIYYARDYDDKRARSLEVLTTVRFYRVPTVSPMRKVGEITTKERRS